MKESDPNFKAITWLQMLIVYAKNPHMHYLSWLNEGVSLGDVIMRFENETAMLDLEAKLKKAQQKLLDNI
jgi:hypothetical protein